MTIARAEVHSFLSKRKLAVLSTMKTTMKAAGFPQSALVGIAVTPELEIVFDTVKSSRKYPNLISNPACSLVVGWEGEQTVQYEGIARELPPVELERYLAIYSEVWPDAPSRQSWPGIVYFVVKPNWLRYSDFDQNPRLIQEFTF